MIKRLYDNILRFSYQCKDSHIDSFAASAAFFLFISMIPCIMLFIAIVPYTPITQEYVYTLIYDILPPNADAYAQKIVTQLYEKNPGIISASALVFLWSAGRGMLAIMRGFNYIYRIPERENYIILRIKSTFYMLVLIVALLLSLVVMVFSGDIHDHLLQYAPYLSYFSWLTRSFRAILLPVALIVVFLFLYKVVPSRKTTWRSQLPGAILSALCWTVFSYFFSIYIDYFDGFSAYGVLASIIILMVWLDVIMCLLLFGCQINTYFEPAFYYLHQKYKAHKVEKKEAENSV